MATLERTITLAARAHEGQLDKAGAPFVLPPCQDDIQARHAEGTHGAAVLHNVVEYNSANRDSVRSTDNVLRQ